MRPIVLSSSKVLVHTDVEEGSTLVVVGSILVLADNILVVDGMAVDMGHSMGSYRSSSLLMQMLSREEPSSTTMI
jgi:hypothetical protein